MHKNQNEIFKYLSILFRRRYVFIFVSMAVMTGLTFYAYSIPKKYKADTTVFIEKSIIDSLVKGIAISSDINDSVRLLKYSILSREMISKALRKMRDVDFDLDSNKIQRYILGLQNRTSVEVYKDNLFKVSIVDSSPVFAQKYINTLVETYIAENTLSGMEDSAGANKFLDTQLQIFREKLDAAENAIIEFRRKQGVYFTTDEAIDLKEIKDYVREIEEIELKINSIEARKARLVSQLASLSPTVDILSHAGGGSSPVELEKRLRVLQLSYTEQYPEVVRLKAELESMRSQAVTASTDVGSQPALVTSVNPLHQELQQQVFEVEAEISSLGARKESLEKRVAQREKELRDVPDNKKKLGVLVQERDSYRQIYQELLGRMGQSEVSRQMEAGDKAATFRIVDPAIFPLKPISPNLVKMLLVAIAAGLGCGFGVVFLLDNLDQTIKDSGQLEAMGMEVLAVIPNIIEGQESSGVKRLDYIVYGVGGVYCSGFFGLLFYELVNH